MKKIFALLLTAVLVLGLAGCAQPVSGQVVQSEKPRVTTPVVAQIDLQTLVDGNTAFAFSLYQILRQKTAGNLFYSPYSISEALAMTWAGARGDTEKAMSGALSFKLAQARLHPAFNSLDLQLKERGKGARGKEGEGFRLRVVNAIWGQKDYQFLPAFLDVLSQNYGAGLRLLDFIKETEKSRVTINDWVAEQTEQRIKDLIPQGVITTLTRLVLTNAVYFNAAWQYPFNEGATSDGQFTLLNGSKVTVPMMRQMESFRYAQGTNYQAIELPYDGRELSMVILLPSSGQFEAFEKSLDAKTVNEIIGKLGRSTVNLTMPKFEFESSFGLKDALTSLGMGVAFTESADLSGMNGKRDLFIQDVVHKAFVAVDEEGTEAAAATAVVVGVTSVPVQQAVMTIDKPFIFFIRDNPTGTVLFVGRVLDPTK
ncbi:MAG: serpin family protein [Dehalococcoidia bacterium]|nr:serpin family protein [Dehalococcoidia bacterium]